MPTPIFKMECGTYEVEGVLNLNANRMFVLTIAQGTRAAAELLVLGGNVEAKLISVAQNVKAQVYVPEVISSTAGKNLVFLSALEPLPGIPRLIPKLIKQEKCGLEEKYVR